MLKEISLKPFFGSVCVAFIALLATPASAQWTISLPPPIQTATYFANNNIGREVAETNVQSEMARARRNSVTQSYSSAAPGVSAAVLNFKTSPQRRTANLKRFVADYVQTNPGREADLTALFMGSPDIIEQITARLSPYGFSKGNLADAYAIYWVNAWEAANGAIGAESTRAQFMAVKRQAAAGLLAVPSMAKASDADKQNFAEVLLVQAVMVQASAEQVQSNPTAARAQQAIVRKGAKMLGVELDIYKLTENGFVLKQGSSLEDDLAPAPGGEGATEVAAASAPAASPAAPTTADANTPPYVLMAAAGGAGLAGVFLLGKVMGKKS
jgi:hypothetical protein